MVTVIARVTTLSVLVYNQECDCCTYKQISCHHRESLALGVVEAKKW